MLNLRGIGLISRYLYFGVQVSSHKISVHVENFHGGCWGLFSGCRSGSSRFRHPFVGALGDCKINRSGGKPDMFFRVFLTGWWFGA